MYVNLRWPRVTPGGREEALGLSTGGAFERLVEQLAQRAALLRAERREDLLLDALHALLGVLDRRAAGVGQLDDVAAAVDRIATTHEIAGVLELVEHQHEIVRIDLHLLAQFLLGRGGAVTQVAE